MLAPLLFALIGPAAPAMTPVTPAPPQALRVWLNRQGTLDRGDKVRAYTRTADDGYLFVLHVEPNGRVRVLFPLDPFDDGFIRAGQDYEIRGRGDREAFQVYETSGAGTVLAAVSPDPYRFDALVVNGHWDYRAADWNMGGDPEADLVALVGRLTNGGRFDYDVVRYVVGGYDVAYGGGDDWYSPGLYDPYYDGHSWYGGSGFSIHVGFGFGRGYGYRRHFYDPWYWDPWDPWWYPSPCWGGCFYPFSYYTPVYYAYPYYGPDRYVYYGAPGGTLGRGYTFKSPDDRYGLSPNPVGVRRRTLATGSGTSPGRAGVAPSGRRTPSAAPAGGRSPDARATPGRRPAGQPSTSSGGSRSPAPRATPERRGTGSTPSRGASPAQPPPSRPAATPGRRQASQSESDGERTPVAERQDDGSYRLPSPPRRTATPVPQSGSEPSVGTLERRADVEPRLTPSGVDRAPSAAPPRGLAIANDAPAPRRTDDDRGGSATGSTAGPSRMPTPTRQVEPRGMPTPSRAAPSNQSGGQRSPSARPARSSGRTPSARPSPTPSSRGPSARPAPRPPAPTRSAPSRPSGGGPSRRNR
jgi:hypothetical protein